MSDRLLLTERYDSTRHQTADFDCGNQALNRWLVQFAGQGQRRDATRTFITANAEGAVHGYYTLLAGEIEHGKATDSVRKGLSRHFPVPVAILARLAVDRRCQEEGLGARLLADALARICRAAEEIAVRAALVHAIDDDAAGFYERFGFRSLATEPRTLMVTLAELREAGYEK